MNMRRLFPLKIFPKVSYMYTIALLGILAPSAYAQSRAVSKELIGNVSVLDEKWDKSGIYGGFSPANELLAKRTENTKVFFKDGKTTAQIGAPMHYKDDNGAWQDISLDISSPLGRSDYKFGNESQKIKSYFPEKAGTQGVIIQLNGQAAFHWWGNPELKYTVNNTIIKRQQPVGTVGVVHKEKVVYSNVYPGMSEEFVVLNGGVENNTIIHQMTSELNALPGNAMVEFSQFIPLSKAKKITTPDGKLQENDFEANYFHIKLPEFEDVLTLSPIVIFDSKLDREEAFMLISAPKDKLTEDQLSKFKNNLYQSKYYVHFTEGGIIITTKLPASWLQTTGRTFPVTVDPTVVIGATPPGTGNFYVPMSHWYGYQRHADLFLQSEIAGYGMVTAIEYYKTNTTISTNKPTKIFMRTTSAATLTGTAAWNSATYTGGLTANLDMNTDQSNTPGWYIFNLTTPFNYSTGNLLIMTYDAYGGGGSAQYFTTNTPTARQAFKRQDTNDPGDASATAVENYLPTIRITYSNPTCSAVPSAGAATTTTPTFNCSGAPLLNATGLSTASNITYQWETSLAGQNVWSDVGGTLTGSPAFTAPVSAVSRDYRVKTTCPTFGTATSALVTVSVNTTVAAGTATTTTPSIICSGGAALDATGVTAGNGMQYQWQSSPAGAGTWTLLGSPSSSPVYVSPSISANTDYRVVSTCGPAFTSNASAPVAVTVQSVSITPATASICAGNSQALVVTAPLPTTLFSENFNSGTGSLIFTNTSSGTTPANAAWTLRPSGYTYATSPVTTFIPPTATQFILSNSDPVGSGAVVNTTMTTPQINVSQYSSLTLTFNHHFYARLASYGRVEVFNGTAWVQLANYTTNNVGTGTAFASESFNLTPYAGIPNLQVRFTYNAGWDWFWAIDDILITGTPNPVISTWTATTGGGLPAGAGTPSSANNNITVTPTATGVYTYTVNTNVCGSNSATLTVNPGPTATISSAGDVCDGEAATLNFTGNPGDVITFNTTESVTLDAAGEATYTTPALTAGSHVYTINTIANTTCTVTSTLSTTVIANPRPNGSFTGSSSACQNSSVPTTVGFNSTTLPADYPIQVTFSDGINTYIETANGSSENFAVPTNVAGTFNYYITALDNSYGCAGIPGTDFVNTDIATVDINALPSVIVTSDDPGVCEGGSTNVTLSFSGTAPYTFDYYDGVSSASVVAHPDPTFTYPVSPAAETDYYVTFLQDGHTCIVSGTDAQLSDSATVIIYDTVAITGQPMSASACTQNSATITMTATGEGLTYAWYENGVAVPVDPNYTVNNNNLTINDVSGMSGNEYYVVVSGTCGADQTSDPATLTEDFENSWTGAVSNSWNDDANWTCGHVPLVTTNVIIPNVTNFATVDIPTAVCNNLTIDLGGMVMFSGTTNMLSIYGDVQNNGTLNGNNGTIVLAGAGAQQVSGATTFDDLGIDGGGTKVINGSATVNGELILTDGFLALGNNDLTITDMSLQTTGSAASYVVTDGSGTITGQNMGSDSTIFHVGTASSYNPVAIKNTGDADTFMVRVMEHVYVDGDGTDPTMVDNPVVDRTWMISEQTPGGSFATVTPQWNAGEELSGFDLTHAYVAHYIGGEWTTSYDSAVHAPAAIGTDPYIAIEDSIDSFSPFTVASSGQFPLAIRLTSITAINVGPRNKVEWKSASEDAGDVYELESSVDARTFKKIATIAANGKASTYTQWDENPVEGVNYYRAKLLSTDGKYSYSKVVSATVNKVSDFTIEAYPNPVHNTVSVKVNGVVTGNGSVVITDVTGKVVSQVTAVANNGAELNVSHLANGIYLLNYTDDVRNESIKINKQ